MPNTGYRAGAIGRTGAGDFGHDLHLAYQDLPQVDFVAVADPAPGGREKALGESGGQHGYTDYREMLAKESLDIVSVCPRWIDCHEELIMACIDAGCHVYSEKVMASSLDSADRIIEAADRAGVKIAVAHQAVYLPQVRRLKQLIDDGRIGSLLGIRSWGKQDHRGGGEDMVVLGTHLFNLMRLFLGDPEWMTSRVLSRGQGIRPGDVREGTEPTGLLAGDSVDSFYSFRNGTWASFESKADRQAAGAGYGMVIHGETGRIAFSANGGDFAVCNDGPWGPWTGAKVWAGMDLGVRLHLQQGGNRLAVLDLIEAIEEDREPLSSARDARSALEMILGAYDSQIQGRRLYFPAPDRAHPLERFVENEG